MKISKKLICTLIATSIISSQAVGTFAFDNSTLTNITNEINMEGETRVAWWEAAWNVLTAAVNAANKWIYVSPVYEKNSYYIKVGSGSIDFNGKTYGGISKHGVYVDSTASEIDGWAERSFIDFASKIVISLDDPSGNLYSNKTCTHQQHFITKPSRTGRWELRYTTSESKRWSCWFFYDPVAPIKSVKTQTLINAETGERITADLYRTSEKMYAVPSEDFKSSDMQMRTNMGSINIDQLVAQTYDENIGRFVNFMKDYSIGDTVVFEDLISEISYDKNSNATKFTFKCKDNDTVDWYFAGDLTSEYNVNDTLKLRFKVVEEYSDENFTFETLDYIKNSSNEQYESIDNYLFK